MTKHGTDAPQPHLEVHEVVAYLEGKLMAAARARLEGHLSDCDQCAAEIAAVMRLRARRPARFRWLTIGTAAAAAAIVGAVLLGPPHRRPVTSGPDVERTPGSAQVIAVVSPAEGAIVAGHPVLRWQAISRAPSYRVTVTREDGDSVWAVSTSDTTVTIPAAVALTSAGRYYWYVDALLPDGASFSSGLHEFKTAP